MVDTWEQRFGNAGRKVVGKDFLGPYIVEPVHRHEITEPHVSRFMCDELGPCQFFIQSRVFAQEHAVVIVQCRSRMLHATVLEARKNDEAILGERVRDGGIVFQPMQGRSHLFEDHIQLGYFLWVRFPMIGRKDSFSVLIFHLFQLACHEREQVSA